MSRAARTSASASAGGSGGHGYSGTPLAKKLGIGAGHRVWLARAPANYKTLVTPLPDGVTFATKPSNTIDVAHVFASKRRELTGTSFIGTNPINHEAHENHEEKPKFVFGFFVTFVTFVV